MNTKTPSDYLNESLAYYAYDKGCVDSGIRDDIACAAFFEWFHRFSENETEWRLTFSRWIRETFLSEAALSRQYGIEDVQSYLRWLSSHGYDI